MHIGALVRCHGTLPRSVTRFGLLLGASFPVALVITAAGYLVGRGFGHPLAFAIPGTVLGAMSWLAFPAWPLVLARMVALNHAVAVAMADGPGAGLERVQLISTL